MRERQQPEGGVSVKAKVKSWGDVPFQALDILPADFVVQDVSHLICRDFLACGTFVNTIEWISIALS